MNIMNTIIKQASVAFFFLLLSFSLSYSQTVYEPITSDVYPYLEKMAQKGLIEFNDLIKPLSREYIYEKLEVLKNVQNQISEVDKEELKFWLIDYGLESAMDNASTPELKEQLKIDNPSSSFGLRRDMNPSSASRQYSGNVHWFKDEFNRYRLFSYSSDLFKVNLDPILGYEMASRDSEKRTHFWNGAYFYGYLGKHIGFSFSFRDNSETGSTIDRTKAFSPLTGIVTSKGGKNNIQYGEVQTSISYSWNWGSFSVGKDYLE